MSACADRRNFVCAFVLLVGIAGMSWAADPPATGGAFLPAANDRKPAPDFALTDASGARVTLSGYQGRVVLLDFWATWCTGCKVEIPWYMAFQRKYARQGLTAIGVAMDDEGWQKVKPYLEMHPINYPIVLGNPDLMSPYHITSLPVTLLIDRNTKIADAHVGMVVRDLWEKEIQLLLREGSGTRR